jgi:hypothetical protein
LYTFHHHDFFQNLFLIFILIFVSKAKKRRKTIDCNVWRDSCDDDLFCLRSKRATEFESPFVFADEQQLDVVVVGILVIVLVVKKYSSSPAEERVVTVFVVIIIEERKCNLNLGKTGINPVLFQPPAPGENGERRRRRVVYQTGRERWRGNRRRGWGWWIWRSRRGPGVVRQSVGV